MAAKRKVAVLVGSLRKGSLNRQMANALCAIAKDTLECEFVDIGGLPLYNQDDETASPPAPWVEFRARIKAADALLFVTPEYNRSVPGCLKNAIDVGSRPSGQSVFGGKPGAVISVSPGAIGGFGANHHLRQSLMCLNVLTMQGPEAYIGGAGKLFDEQGNVTVEATREFLQKFMGSFAVWIETLAPRA
jgi:chromate reductase, NAD(P)H dehydrogenase (quinone)